MRSIPATWALFAVGAALILPPRAASALEPPRPASKTPASADATAPRPPAPAGALIFDSGGATQADPAGKARGRALYEQGAQAYADGGFLRAAELFLDAYRAYPTPQLLFNVGKAYDRAGSAPGALSYYRDYLRHLPDAPDMGEVSARVHELEAALAERGVQQISVISEPALATVLLDGSPVGVTPWTGETWPGKHRVSLELRGRKPAEAMIDVSTHRAEDFRFLLEAQPIPAPTPRPPQTAARESTGMPSALTWVVLGVGTAALGTALFVEMANQDAGGISRTGAFFGGAGLSACAVGGILLYVDFKQPSDPNPARGAAPRGLTATLSARF